MPNHLTWHRLKRRPKARPEYSLRCGTLHVLCLFLTHENGWRVSFYDDDAHNWIRAKTLEGAKREAVRLAVRRAEAAYVRASRVMRAATVGVRDV